MTSSKKILCAALLGGALASTSGCVIRAQARVRPVAVVHEAPPPPREERVEHRAGYVFVRGHWESRGGRWVWAPGHWQRARAGYVWVEGRWDMRGGRHHWVEGRWEAGGPPVHAEHTPPAPTRPNQDVVVRDHRTPPPPPAPTRPNQDVVVRDSGPRDYPTAPPPAPQAESPGAARAGFIWIGGYYRWENGGYNWIPGHWERAKARKSWRAGVWERRGDRYVWVEGRWE